jgi:hypothetical protein
MEEVITNAGGEDENTIWQARPKDQSLETEMLYRFTVYLGSAVICRFNSHSVFINNWQCVSSLRGFFQH